MTKKILVAVGGCIHSKLAAKYAATVCSAVEDVTYTLFNVQPAVPNIILKGLQSTPELQAEVDAIIRQNDEEARCIVDEMRALLLEWGIPRNRIEVATAPMHAGMAKDILKRGEEGGYDAILLARRGLTPSRDFFIGTTAAKVVDHGLSIPVWVVDGETSPLSILVAVDGSQSSIRLLDYVLKMVGANRELNLTLLHVAPHLRHYYTVDFERANPRLQELVERTDRKRMEAFYNEAYDKIKRAGIRDGQVHMKTSTGDYDVSTAILGEARCGGYGTVVIGRRGEREAFFTGRIAMRLVQKVSGQVLWVVP
jgi:nucleotide-binding universal stress UspA family protein